jgi:hypothetical protein
MNATQVMSSAQPSKAIGPHGLAAVAFDGAQTMELPFGFDDFSSGLSLFIASTLAPARTGGPVLALGFAGTGCARGAQLALGPGGFDYRVENTALGSPAAISAAWEVFSAVQSPFDATKDAGQDCPTSTTELRRSGIAVGSDMVKVLDTGGRAGTNLGHSVYFPDDWLSGIVGEVVLYDRALTAAETAAVNEYLSQKWAR